MKAFPLRALGWAALAPPTCLDPSICARDRRAQFTGGTKECGIFGELVNQVWSVYLWGPVRVQRETCFRSTEEPQQGSTDRSIESSDGGTLFCVGFLIRVINTLTILPGYLATITSFREIEHASKIDRQAHSATKREIRRYVIYVAHWMDVENQHVAQFSGVHLTS